MAPRRPASPPRARQALLVAPADTYGGAERILATAARALAARPDWDVEIATIGARTGTAFIADNCGAAAMTYGSGGGGLGAEWRLAPRLAGRAFDLVVSSHVRVNAALATARRLGLLRARRLVARESTVIIDRAAGARLLAYRSLYRLYGAQDLIIAQTSYMADRLKTVLPSAAAAALEVVPNPLDRAAVEARARMPLEPALARRLAEAPHIAWCGRLIGVKNPLRAIAALAEARARSGQDLRLAVVGSGPLAPAVEQEIAGRGLRDAVLLVGDRPNPYPILAACPYGLLTSDTEGFPNVLLEMMACGVRQIVTTPCAGDLDGLTGVHVAEGFSPEILAERLVAAVRSGRDNRPAYDAPLGQRSLEAFLSRLLGDEDGPRRPSCNAGFNAVQRDAPASQGAVR
jgi:glycosyltransferase involved in cell wall biosynthesis